MIRLTTRAAAVVATAGLLAAGAPSAVAAQPAGGSVELPIVILRPFDIPVWQLPPLPHPFAWDMNVPHAPAPAPPEYGDPCSSEQVYEVHDRRLVCVYAGAPTPSWVFIAEEALNPDGTLNLDYPAG